MQPFLPRCYPVSPQHRAVSLLVSAAPPPVCVPLFACPHQSRALSCAAKLEAIPLEDLAETLTSCSPSPSTSGEPQGDQDAAALLRGKFTHVHGNGSGNCKVTVSLR